ncbi:MAG: hypothetical protein AAB696_01875, partial [Patescibacteria group bacterium]
ALNMYGPYYLLPAYIFALPSLIYFFNKSLTFTWDIKPARKGLFNIHSSPPASYGVFWKGEG